jgi:DNA-binding Lrp family transcriptional regulator
VRLSHAKLENFSRIYAYCAECPEVCFVVRCIGAHELELEVATASVDEFDAFAARFRQAFARDVRDMESLRVIRERKISFYK